MLEGAIAFFALFNVLIWYDVLVDAAPQSAVWNTIVTHVPASFRPTIAAMVDPRAASEEQLDETDDPMTMDDKAPVALPVEKGTPVRLRIPSIAVHAAIERVSLAADGSMGVPKHPGNVAWFTASARPGDVGSAAIAGHVDAANGAAVFADLHKVRSGDTIEVLDGDGKVAAFVVRDIRKYAATAAPVEVFSSQDGKAHLNLITCGGAWDEQAKQYEERLVVFTDKKTE